MLLAASVAGRAQNGPRYILVLTSFEQQFSPHNVFYSAFRAELTERSSDPVQFIDVSLPPTSQTRRRATEPEATLFYLRTTFAIHRPHLIVSVGGVAGQFVQEHRQQIFPDTPILFASVDQRFIQANPLTANEAAAAVSIDAAVLLENILKVRPKTRQLAVVIGSSELETAWRTSMTAQFKPFADRVSILWLHDLSFAQMLKRCSSLPPDSAILFAHLGVDSHGLPLVEERALPQLHTVANAPIFGVFNSQLGHGIVGGPLLNLNQLGKDAADVAERILRGEWARDLTPPPQRLGCAGVRQRGAGTVEHQRSTAAAGQCGPVQAANGMAAVPHPDYCGHRDRDPGNGPAGRHAGAVSQEKTR